MNKTNKISFEAILFAVYLFIAPIHQVLRLGNGATVNKYLSLGVMVIIFITQTVKRGKFYTDYILLKNSLYYLLWCAVSILWAADKDFGLMQGIISYIALFIVVCSNEWNNNEKRLFRNVIMISCVFFSIQLISSAGEMKRASIVMGKDELEADQNVLSANLAFGAIIASYYFISAKKSKKLIIYLMIPVIILTGIICTGSRGALLSLIGALIYLFYCNRNNNISRNRMKIMSVILVCGLITVLFTGILKNDYVTGRFTGEKNDTSGRGDIVLQYLDVMNDKPFSYLIGFGFISSGKAYGNYFNMRFPPATHNDYLSLICDTGIIGLFLFLNLIIFVWKRAKSQNDFLGRTCLLLMLLMMTNVNIMYRYGFWNAMIFAYIGLGAGVNDEKY